jgi:hypothetical protein
MSRSRRKKSMMAPPWRPGHSYPGCLDGCGVCGEVFHVLDVHVIVHPTIVGMSALKAIDRKATAGRELEMDSLLVLYVVSECSSEPSDVHAELAEVDGEIVYDVLYPGLNFQDRVAVLAVEEKVLLVVVDGAGLGKQLTACPENVWIPLPDWWVSSVAVEAVDGQDSVGQDVRE